MAKKKKEDEFSPKALGSKQKDSNANKQTQTGSISQSQSSSVAKSATERSKKSTFMGGTETTPTTTTSTPRTATRNVTERSKESSFMSGGGAIKVTNNNERSLQQWQTQKSYGTTSPKLKTSAEAKKEREERRRLGQAQKSGDMNRVDELTGVAKSSADRFNGKYTKNLTTRERINDWDKDISDTIGHTLKQIKTSDLRYINQGMQGITKKDAYLYTTEEQRKKADAKVEQREAKYSKQLAETNKALEDIQNKHGYVGKKALEAVSSTTGMAVDLGLGALTGGASLFHMKMRSTGGTMGQVQQKADALRKQLKDTGYYTDEELDEMFKDVKGRDLLNAEVNGDIEAMSELFFRGVGPVAKYVGGSSIAEKIGSKLLNKAGGKATSSMLKNVLKGTAEEAAEEEIAGSAEAFAANQIYGNKYQGYQEDAIKRSLADQSNALKSQIKSEDDARQAAARLSSQAFLDESIQTFMDSGKTREEATKLAEMSRDYLTAGLSGDVDGMKASQDAMVELLAGGENDMREHFTLKDAIDAAVVSTMITLPTGLPGAVSTQYIGETYKENVGLDAVKAQTEIIKNWGDDEEQAQAQAVIDHIDDGGDISGTQVYEIIQKSGEIAEQNQQPEITKNRVAEKEMKQKDLRISPINPDGSLAPQTKQRYVEIVSQTVARYETLARLGNKSEASEDFVGPSAPLTKRSTGEAYNEQDVAIGANIGAAFETGVITSEMVNDLVSGSETVKAVFEDVTGIDVNQFDSNKQMLDSLMAEAAQNMVNSARLEQIAWNDETRKQMSDYLRKDVGSKGDLAVQNALESVDPRDRTQFLMMGDVSRNIYDFGRYTEGTWEEAKLRYKSMYPSLDSKVLKQVFDAAKKDKDIAETEGYGKVVTPGKKIDRSSLSNATTDYVAGTYNDKRQNKEGAKLTEESLLKNFVSAFGFNVDVVDDMASVVRDKDGNVVLDEEGNPLMRQDNGAFIPATNTLVVNANADTTRTITQTAVHELTHYIAVHAPEEYIKLQKYIMDAWYRQDSAGFERAIKSRQALYKAQKGQELSVEQALEEIIADGAADFNWGDEEFIAEVTTKEPTLADRIIDAIKDVLRKLRSILSSGDLIDEASTEALYAKVVELDTVRSLWVQAAQAARKERASQAIDEWQDNANRASIRTTNDVLANRDDTAIFIKNTANADYIDMIFNGEKTEETRAQRTLDAFIGKEVAVTDGKKVYGTVVLGEPHQISAEEFHKDENQRKHRVPKDDDYDVKEGKSKWAYPIESYTKYEEPRTLSKDKDYLGSYQARQTKYSVSDSDYMDAVEEYQRLYDAEDFGFIKAEQKLQKMVDEVAIQNGYTLKAYHGTNSEPFNVFDRNHVAHGRMHGDGFYFSPYEEVAGQYGQDIREYYLKTDGLTEKELGSETLAATEYKEFPKSERDAAREFYHDKMAQFSKYGQGIERYRPESKTVNGMHRVTYTTVGAFQNGLIMVATEPEYIKSADPITYDDSGNVIPLSERFNPENQDTRYSVMITDSEGNPVTEQEAQVIHDVGPDVRFSVPTEKKPQAKATFRAGKGEFKGFKLEASGRELRTELIRQNFPKAQADKIINTIDSFMDTMANFLTDKNGLRMKYQFIGWDDLESGTISIRRDRNNKIKSVNFSAMKKNDEYPVNFDFSTVCNKRIHFTKVIEEIAQAHDAETGASVFSEIKLTPDNMWKINEALKAEGIDTACLGCFVESRRYHIDTFFQNVETRWNEPVREARRKLGLDEEEYFNFSKEDITGEEWSAADDNWGDYGRSKAFKGAPLARTKALMDEIVKAGDVNSPLLKLIKPSDLLTPEGFEGFRKLSNAKVDLIGQIKSMYGAGVPKEILGFTPYNSEIALLPKNYKPKNGKRMSMESYLKSIGGIRIQSFSDFMIEHVYDHFQLIADAAYRKLPIHAYTKVIAYAKIFGLTGAKINMSVMFDVMNSKQWADALGISEENAKQYADKYQGLRFVTEVPAEYQTAYDNADKDAKLRWKYDKYIGQGFAEDEARRKTADWAVRPYRPITLEGKEGYLTYLVSDADYVNEQYQKLYDQYIAEGMTPKEAERKANSNKPFEQSINYREAKELQDREGYKNNVGIIGVAFGDEHLRMMMDDENVRYIIPYHSSSLPVVVSTKTNLKVARDYSDRQSTYKAVSWKLNGKDVADLKGAYEEFKKSHKDEPYPAQAFFAYAFENNLDAEFGGKVEGSNTGAFDVYEHLDKAKDIHDVSEAYLEDCIDNNYIPVFHEFADHPGYYKMLFDFMVADDEGVLHPQQNVRNNYPGVDIDAKAEAGESVTDNDLSELQAVIEEGAKAQNDKLARWEEHKENVMQDLLSREGEHSIISDSNINSIRYGTEDYTDPKDGTGIPSDSKMSIAQTYDEPYMKAVESGNMEEAQRLVDEAAMAAMPNLAKTTKGRMTKPLSLYHGTRFFGFTEFKDSKYEVPFIYTSTDRSVSAHYAGDQHYAFTRPIGKPYREGDSTEDIIENAKTVWQSNYHVMTPAEKKARYTEVINEASKIADKIDELNRDVSFDSFADGDDYSMANAIELVKYPFWVSRDMDDDFYYNFDEDNGYREESVSYHEDAIEGFERNIERVREYYFENRKNLNEDQKKLLSYLISYEVGDAAIDLRSVLNVMTEEDRLINEHGNINVPSGMKEAMDAAHNIASYELYGDLGENPFEFDAGGAQWWGLKVPEVSDEYTSTDAVCKWAYEHGYTSVIMHNIYDYGDKADNYVFFNSAQLKSADTVTYREDGSVIPLSERFDPNNNDIRYSLPTTDADGNILTDGQMEYFKNSQARDSQGRLVPVYHTTDEGGFTVFDPLKSDDHRCLFFSDRLDVSSTYSDKGYDRVTYGETNAGFYAVYLNLQNPMIINGNGQYYEAISLDTKLPKDCHLEIYTWEWLLDKAKRDDYMYKIGQRMDDGKRIRREGEYARANKEIVLKFEDGKRVSVKEDVGAVTRAINQHYGLENNDETGVLLAEDLIGKVQKKRNGYQYWLNESLMKEITSETHDTREWAEIAQNLGYDGVIFKDIIDIGSDEFYLSEDEMVSDIYVAFSSNQVKDIDNQNPTENPDIRYSTPDDNELDAYAASQFANDNSYEALAHYEELIEQDKGDDYYVIYDSALEDMYLEAKKYVESNVDKFYAGLNAFADDYRADDVTIEEGRNIMAKSKQEYFNSLDAKWNDRWRTEGTVLEVKSVKKQVRELVKSVMQNSDTDHAYRTSMVDRALIDMRLAYDLAKRGREDVAYALLWHSALKMIDGVEFYEDDGTYEAYKGLRDYLKSTKISLGREYWSDVKFGEFRKRNGRRIKLVKGNTNVDKVYQEMQEMWPEWFDEEDVSTPPEQLLQIEHVLDAIKPYKAAYSSEEAASLAADIANDMFNIMTEEGKEVKSLADKYNEKYDKATKALKVRHAEAMLKVRQQRDEAVRKTNEKWVVKENKRKERLAHNKAFEHIQKSYDELYKRLTTNTVDKHIPEQYKLELANLLLAFDLQTVRSKQIEAKRGYKARSTIKLAEMRSVLKKIGARSDLFVVNDSITDIIDDLLGENNAYFSHSIEGETIDQLSASELTKIDKLFKSLLHEFNNYEKVRVNTKKMQAAEIGHAMVDSCLDHRNVFGEAKDYQGLVGALDRIPNLDEVTAAYLFRRIDPNKVGMKLMFDEINRSFDHYVRNTEQLQKWMKEILGEYQNHGRGPNKYGADQIAEWRNPHSRQRIYLENGMIELTPAQMMSLYCLSKRAQAHDHMTGAGIVVAPVTFNAKKLSDLKPKSMRANLPQKLTDYDIERIKEHLTPDQVKVADKLQELMATKMAEWGNEASMSVIGIKLFEDPNYFPIWSDKRALTKELNEDQFIEAIRNFGFTKAVQPGARNAIMIDDIFTIVSEHCNNMNLYNSYSESMNDFMKVYNYRDFREDGSEITVEQAIANAYSQKATTFIRQFMKDLNGNVSGSSTGIISAINDLLGKAKKASVFANVRVLLQQPTAITRAFAVISPKYLKAVNLGDVAKGVIPTVTTNAMQEMFDHCPRAWWKAQGYYDINMGRSVEDVMMNNGSFLDDIATSAYGKADNITWTAIWQMCKAEVEDKHPKVEKGSDEYWELCNERMTEVVDLTQVMDSPIHRSHGMRSKDIVMKSFTSFMAEPTLTFNMLRASVINGLEEIKAGSTAKGAAMIGRAAAVLLLQAATVSAAAGLWDAVRGKNGDDDEEQTFMGLWWINCIENFKDEMKLWNKVYFIKDIDSMMQGYGYNNLALQGFKMISDGWNQLTGHKRVYSSKSWYENLFGGIGYLTGVPFKTLIGDTKAIYNLFGLDWQFANDFGAYLDEMAADPSEDNESVLTSFMNIFRKDGEAEEEVKEKKGLFERAANKMGYKKKGDTSISADANTEEESSYDVSKDDLPDNLTDKQKQDILKAGERRAKKNADKAEESGQLEYDEMLYKAMKASAGLEGEEYNKAVYSSVAQGLKGYVADGDYLSIGMMRTVIEQAGGDVDYFDKRVLEETRSAYKKTLNYNQSVAEYNDMRAMYRYMANHGMSQEDISAIVYESDMAKKDLKVAYILGDEGLIAETMTPLLNAGILSSDLERIYRNRNRIDLQKYKDNHGRYAEKLKSRGTFIWPTHGTITSHFGYRNAPTAGASSNHPAIDIGAPMGTEVVAADGGVVIYAGTNGGYGNSVGIKHDNGMVTYYNHLSGWSVKVGDTVGQGQPIAQVGSTGVSTGPHLDFKILDKDGNPVDPEKYLLN